MKVTINVNHNQYQKYIRPMLYDLNNNADTREIFEEFHRIDIEIFRFFNRQNVHFYN